MRSCGRGFLLAAWLAASISTAWAAPTHVSGRLFVSHENLTPVPNRNVSISVSGVTIADTTTAADGTFSFAGVGIESGDVVLLFSDNGFGVSNANTVFVDWTGSGSPVTDVFLYEDNLAVQSRGTGVVTHEDLRIADASPGSTLFSVTDDLLIEAAASFFIPHGVQFLMVGTAQLQPRGDFRVDGTFQAGVAGVDAGGNIYISSGAIFDAGMSTTSVAGDLAAAGQFTNSGAVIFDGAASSAFDPGSNSFADIIISKTDGAGVTLAGAALTAQNLSVTAGAFELRESAAFDSAVIEALGTLLASSPGKTYAFGSIGAGLGLNNLALNGGTARFRGAGSQLLFGSGATVVVSGGATFEISGAPGQEILVSTIDASTLDRWVMDVDASANLSIRSAEIANSQASGMAAPLTAFDSIDGGNNTGWLFTQFPALVADASANQTVHVGTTTMLDGSGSISIDSYPLGYHWSIVSAPAGSTAGLSGSDAAQPLITPDLPGEYLIELVVIDQITLDASLPELVVLTATNTPPVADAGGDQTTPRNLMVTLDASGSSDPDEDSIRYFWSLAVPSGSTASLSDSASMNPSFVVDLAGDYVATLTVHDGFAHSAPDTVTVSTFNAAPVADAGDDQVIMEVGSVVELDGSTSFDEDGDDLVYAWSVVNKPIGSFTTLSDASAPNPTFTADVNGEYVFQLTVTDEFGAKSDPDPVTISFENVAPVAHITAQSTTIVVGSPLSLNASDSSDANGDPLSYSWSLISRPADSEAKLSDPNAYATSLSTDMVGEYVASLVVSDGIATSEPSTVLVVTVGSLNTVIRALFQLSDQINGLDCEVFTNCSMKKTLSNKLSVVAMNLRKGEYRIAHTKLVMDFQPKMDGCAIDGWPDKNDWILQCDGTQDEIRWPLRALIDGLATLF